MCGYSYTYFESIFVLMNKIKISGEISNYQGQDAKEYGLFNLSMLQNQLKGMTGDIELGINSPGGSVDEGFAIYSEIRRYAKEHNAKVTTISEGQCGSIATVIFLSGDERIVSRYISPFVHNAWTFADGDADSFKRVAIDLETVNNRIAKFYAEHTNLTYEDAKELMNNETYITPEEALEIRFATKIEEVVRPAALQRINKKPKEKMKNQKEAKFMANLRKLFSAEINNLVTVFTSTNDELEFPDLDEGQSPSVGDKATIGGASADGEYTLQNGDVYVFSAGELTEIRKKEEEDSSEDIEALKQENEQLKQKLEAQAVSISEIQAKQKEQESTWNKLKATISSYQVDEDDDTDKTKEKAKEKKGLAGSVARMRDKNQNK